MKKYGINKNTPTTRVAIVDDHQIIIDGLKLLLKGSNNYSIVAEATSAKEMLSLLKQQEADVLITDIMMPGMDGFDLSVKVKIDNPGTKILALSMSEDGFTIAKMIEQAKINGFIPKASGKQELLYAIEQVMNGEQYFSPSILQQYKAYLKVKSEGEAFNLTGRELEIIGCMVQHLSNKEIAGKLFISERTVETHRKNIFRKTNTKGVATLLQFVKKHNLLH